MDALDVLLFWVVGFAALVFLIVENLDSVDKRRRTCREADQSSLSGDSQRKTRTGPYFGDTVKASDDQDGGKVVGAAEKQLVSEEIIEEEENRARASASFENPGFSSSGETGDDICRDMGTSDCSGEGGGESLEDWEGIERTDLEKIFGEAVVYASNADEVDEDVKLQLYGLQKVALEGACHGSQPMAFKVSARAKWYV